MVALAQCLVVYPLKAYEIGIGIRPAAAHRGFVQLFRVHENYRETRFISVVIFVVLISTVGQMLDAGRYRRSFIYIEKGRQWTNMCARRVKCVVWGINPIPGADVIGINKLGWTLQRRLFFQSVAYQRRIHFVGDQCDKQIKMALNTRPTTRRLRCSPLTRESTNRPHRG